MRAEDQSTRQRVVRSILVDGPSTAAALAERLDLTPAAVRRHLDQLLDEGAVEAREPRHLASRGRGRPAKVFALTEAGRDGFDQQYDDLAVQALRFVAETGGEQAVREFANRRVAFVEERFHDVHRDQPQLSPAEVLARVFTDEGYAASVREVPVDGEVWGMHVVQTPSPWAMVASRCTWLPSTRPIAAVSASHSCGNSWATCETGQCCWHSCSPTGTSRTEAA